MAASTVSGCPVEDQVAIQRIMKQSSYEPLEAALLFMADRCDGAASEDGKGFNKNDSLFGKAMADKVRTGKRLTHDEYKSAYKIIYFWLLFFNIEKNYK